MNSRDITHLRRIHDHLRENHYDGGDGDYTVGLKRIIDEIEMGYFEKDRTVKNPEYEQEEREAIAKVGVLLNDIKSRLNAGFNDNDTGTLINRAINLIKERNKE